CSRAAARSSGLVKRVLPSASVWSAPTTSRPRVLPAPTRAFSRASSTAASAAPPTAARASTARSSMSAGAITSGMPAASIRARRTALFEASTSGSAWSHSDMSIGRRAPPLGQQRDHGGRGLLDRAPRHVDGRPAVLGTELARERDLLGHRLAIDVAIVVAMGFEAEQAVLPDRHDAFPARRPAHAQRLLDRP